MFRRRPDEDFSEEVQAHLALEADRLMAEGLSEREAHAAARRAFGNVTRARERYHESSSWTVLEQLAQDVRYAVRGLASAPGFTATAVVTLAVGLAVVTVAYAVIDAYFLRPYAVRDPGGLHVVAWRSPEGGGQRFRWRDYEAFAAHTDLFDAVLAEHTRLVSSNGRPLAVALVSPNYFAALAPSLALGRLPRPAEAAGALEAIVLSDQGWARLFGRDPAAIGQSVDVNGRAFTVIGVIEPPFAGLGDMPRDGWLSLPGFAALADPALTGQEQPRRLDVIARLRNGVTPAQVEGVLTPLVASMLEGEDAVRAALLPQSSPHPLSLQTVTLLAPAAAAFLLVLVTACANVSNVMLARSLAREREIAVRLSLGASAGRIVRQLLTEGLLVALLAGVAGLAAAALVLRAGMAWLPATLPPSVADFLRFVPLAVDGRVFLFALVTATATTLAFALAPAVQASRPALAATLRGHGGASHHSSRLRGALVIGQVAVSLVLVIVAITLARNGRAVGGIDPGYETAGVISVNIRGDDHRALPRLHAALSSEPEVAAATVTSGNPLFGRVREVAASPADGGAPTLTPYSFVGPDYFRLLRIPIASGRTFSPAEAASGAPVAVVSAVTAGALWPRQNPIGRTIRVEGSDGGAAEHFGHRFVTVVGVVPDVLSGLLVDGMDAGHIYLPVDASGPRAVALLVRGRRDGEPRPETLQAIFTSATGDPQSIEVLPLDEMHAVQMYPLRAAAWIGGVLAVLALALGIAGLYGVLAYTIGQRTREIGIRMALGAQAGAVVRFVMGHSVRLAGVGAIAGAVVAFAALRVLASQIQLETISVVDPLAFLGGFLLVGAATAIAAFQPARRAAHIDPARTLRAGD
jgi:predicted permease